MDDNHRGITRRKFIGRSALAGVPFLVPDAWGGPETVPSENVLPEEGDDLLRGASDIHVHCAPDSKPRLTDELSLARDARRAGYRCVLFKSNDFSCHDRVFLIRQMEPELECYGSFCMNRVHGDRVNAYAAAKAVQTTGNFCRCIWLPAQDAVYQNLSYHGRKEGIPVLDEAGRPLPEVVRVMEICAEAGIMLASGHSSPEESLVLAKKAREVGVRKFVVTHANSGIWKMTHDQVKKAMDLGAWVEFSYITNLWGPGTGLPDFQRMDNREFAEYLRLDPSRSFITTDLGQAGMPHPVQGMRTCLREMLKQGMDRKALNLLARENPAMLAGSPLA